MQRVLWITGAGSGVGQAVARSASHAGWTVVLSGRRPGALRDTASTLPGPVLELPLDVRDGDAVRAARARVVAEFGRIDALVLAAGRNTPRRQWDDQDVEEFHDVVAVNLGAVVTVLDAALPDLRERSGVAVVISSYAGWSFHPSAGVAYSASKSALSSVVRTLNSGEAAHGVRATHLCPGDVDTDFLAQRPQVPDATARGRMLTPDDVARTVQFVLDSPTHVRIDELVLSPTSQR